MRRLAVALILSLSAVAHADPLPAFWDARTAPAATLAAASAKGSPIGFLTELLNGLGSAGGLTMQRIDLVQEPNGSSRVSLWQMQVNLGAITSASAVMSASCANGACQARLEASTR